MKGKKVGIIIGAVAGAVLIAGGVIAGIALFKKQPDTYRVIKVIEADGHNLVTRGEITDLEAYEGMALQSGDSIHVDGNSSLVLMMDEDKLAYVEQNTDFNIVAEGSAKDSRTKIEVVRGALTCEIQNNIGANSTYEINTPNSTMAVMGTSFRLEVTNVDTINEVLQNDAIQPSFNFMAENLKNSGITGLNTITRLTVTDGKVKVQLHDENGNPVGDEITFDADTDVLIGGNDTNSCIIQKITGIDISTFSEITIEFFYDIATGSGKMVIAGNDLKDALEENENLPHTVTFMYGTKVFAKQVVEYNGYPEQPEFIPTPSGEWDVDFGLPVTTDLVVYWKEN